MDNQPPCTDTTALYLDGERVGTVEHAGIEITHGGKPLALADDHLSPALKTARVSVFPTLWRLNALCESPDFERLEPKTRIGILANLEQLRITYALEEQLQRIDKQLVSPSTGARRRRRLREQQQRVAAQLDARPVVG